MTAEVLAQTMRAFQSSRVLLTAVELDLFTAVGRGGSAAEVTGRLGANGRAVEILLNALVALGALSKDGHTYRNSPLTARLFDEASDECERLAWMHTVHLWDSWSGLTECVRPGVSATEGSEREEQWTASFIAAMHRGALERAAHVADAVDASPARRLLDVGGGPGTYSIAFATRNPRLEAVVLDRPEVLPITRRHIEQAGLEGRVHTTPGDLREGPLGDGYDLVLVSNICHMLSPDENLDLLERCREALLAGGRIVIQDFILNAEKTGPLPAALFSVNMLVNTPNGASYSEKEYSSWLERKGFRSISRVEIPGPTSLILAVRGN
jgi:SAM-dependent methyltransferase